MNDAVRPELLIGRLMSGNESWRVDAEARLIALGDLAVDHLLGALRHASPSVRVHAVHALSRIQNARAIPAVVGALADSENLGAVAIAAERALVHWGDATK